MAINGELNVEYHGGQCCGIKHLYNFMPHWQGDSLEDKKDLIRRAIISAAETYDSVGEGGACPCGCGLTLTETPAEEWQFCAEVVLSEDQWEHFEQAVLESGFQKSFQFFNQNSGNECRVYHKQCGE